MGPATSSFTSGKFPPLNKKALYHIWGLSADTHFLAAWELDTLISSPLLEVNSSGEKIHNLQHFSLSFVCVSFQKLHNFMLETLFICVQMILEIGVVWRMCIYIYIQIQIRIIQLMLH